jgi:hypothetical protein
MKYLLLIYHEENAWNRIDEAEKQTMYAGYRALREELTARRVYLNGSQLQPTSKATSVRIRDGKDLVTDGPFAETHEQLGGYFLIEAANQDEAIRIAKQIPSAKMGTIEVRPLVEMQATAGSAA